MRIHAWVLFIGSAAALLGCTGRTASISPCEGFNSPAGCDNDCSRDNDCEVGLYCSVDRSCTADCTPLGNECPAGDICNDRGRCQPEIGNDPDIGDPMDCPSIEVQAESIIPTVQLVIDHSSSMKEKLDEDQNGDPIHRYSAVRDALIDPTTGIVAELESRVKFGVALYTNYNADDSKPCPFLLEEPIGLDNFEDVHGLLSEHLKNISALGDETPTGESIHQVVANFPAPEPNARHVILLATDGNPDTCENPKGTDEAKTLSENEVEAAHDKGIDVYVLSVGNDASAEHLTRMARLGVGQDPDTGTADFVPANNSTELIDAFNQIINGARECKFALNGNVLDPAGGRVELNGTALTYLTDWQMVEGDQSTIELLGAACDTFLNEISPELKAEFDCDAVVIK